MRMYSFTFLAAIAAFLQLSTMAVSEAQTEGTVYFLAAGPRHAQTMATREAEEYESFVVPVNDPTQIAEIRSFIQRAEYVIVTVRIQANNNGVNRDFYAPGAPGWNWSVRDVLSVDQGSPGIGFPGGEIPPPGTLSEPRFGSASMIAADPQAWIARNGDEMQQQWFPIVTEVNPFKTPTPPDPELPVMANLSTRAITAGGQDTFIGGIIVSGSRPKQVAVRSSGRNILGPFGIVTAVTSPRVRVFTEDGTQVIALKSERDIELFSRFPSLASQGFIRYDDTLAIITLYPGAYTFHVFDENGRTGVVLFELYDLSLAPQPFP